MLLTPRLSDAVMIEVEHLHYGKLVSDDNGGLVSSEGQGVTRRSAGIDPAWGANLRVTSLLGVPIFDTEMIDPELTAGLLFVRTFPRSASAFADRTVLLRARFRPENGEGAQGRVHQQAAIWVVSPNDWRNHAPSILTKASKDLQAIPDRVGEPSSSRFGVPPKSIELIPDHQATSELHSDAVFGMLDMLLPHARSVEDGSDRCITFGGDTFSSENEFLKAVGIALSRLSEAGFTRWPDICIGSGLRHKCGGLLIRYLPSERTERTPSSDRISVERRLQKIAPVRVRSDLRTFWSPVDTKSSTAAPSLAPADPMADMQDFKLALRAYRSSRTTSGEQKAANELVTLTEFLRASTQNNASSLTGAMPEQDEQVYDGILTTFAKPSNVIPLGALFDRVELLVSAKVNTEVSRAWMDALADRIGDVGILLKQELARLKPARCYVPVKSRGKVEQIVQQSGILAAWCDPGQEREIPREALISLGARLIRLLDPPKPHTGCTGIHEDALIEIDALLSEQQFEKLPEMLGRTVLPRVLQALERL